MIGARSFRRLWLVRIVIAASATLACSIASAQNASAQSDGEVQKDSPEAAVVRGGIVFRTYCVLCHGASGEGNGRTARMYNPRPANLVKSQHNDAYKEQIVRRGGEGMGRSPFMPPWGEQLTDEQITDLVQFMKSISRP